MTLPKGAPIVIPVVICICISYSMTSLAITRYKEVYGHSPWCHESSIAALIGLIVGGAIKFFTGSAVEFDNDVFFYVVLPPIIFSAGMSLKKKMFFRYISLITLFGVMGTVINFSLITAATYHATRMFDFKDNIFDRPVNLSWEHSMLLAAVLSGTDEVSALSLMPMKEYPRLGALIFGEGVLNDAISIVLFHVLMSNHARDESNSAAPLEELAFKLILEVTNEVFLSFAIGVSCGLANARLLKSLTYLREHPIHQTVLLLLFAYLAYTIAESVGVSGILTLFVAAVTQGHYSWHSLSKPAQVATKINAVALSDIAEGFAFSYVGLSMWEYVDDGFHVQFSLFILFVVITSRLITILVLCFVCKYSCKGFNMPLSEQLGFTLGGIVRGCLCWAQILQIGEHRVLVTTTLFIVMTTSLAGGFLMPIIIPRLGLKPIQSIKEDQSPRREAILKRSYKNNPKHNALRNSMNEKEKNLNRRLSIYNFNYHANAEDDLYASEGNSPVNPILPILPILPGSPDTPGGPNLKANGDGNGENVLLNSTVERFSIDGRKVISLLSPSDLDCNNYDDNGNNTFNSNNSNGNNGNNNNGNNNGMSSANFLERMKSPRNFSSWGSVGEAFHKKKKNKVKKPSTSTLNHMTLRNIFTKKSQKNTDSECKNCENDYEICSVENDLTGDNDSDDEKQCREGGERGERGRGSGKASGKSSGRGDSGKGGSGSGRDTGRDTGRESGISSGLAAGRAGGKGNENASEKEERLQEEREDRGDYDILDADIENLNDINDEIANNDQIRTMTRHQAVLDKIAASTARAGRMFFKDPKGSESGSSSERKPSRSVSFAKNNDITGNTDLRDTRKRLDTVNNEYNENNLLNDKNTEKVVKPSSNWSDINQYKKVNFNTKDNKREMVALSKKSDANNPRAGSEKSTLLDIKRELKRESYRGSIAQENLQLSRDNRCNSDPGSTHKVYKSQNFINWVKFDEEFLKPLFGGSQREYTSIPDPTTL